MTGHGTSGRTHGMAYGSNRNIDANPSILCVVLSGGTVDPLRRAQVALAPPGFLAWPGKCRHGNKQAMRESGGQGTKVGLVS